MARTPAFRRHFLLLVMFITSTSLVWMALHAAPSLVASEPQPGTTLSSAAEGMLVENGISSYPNFFRPLEQVGIVSNRHDNGRVDTTTASINGPGICTAFGDPFTPENPWVERPFSYRYRLVVPPDYEQRAGTSILRVEILDPDSINSPLDTQLSIVHTTLFSDSNPAIGQSEPPQFCGSNQREACQLATCEWDRQACPGVTGFSLDEANPFWTFRLDENRGHGPGNGDGLCASPASYTPRYNTATQFRLVYGRQQAGVVSRQLLAAYTGQTGDSARDLDLFSHPTDLTWVTPGGYNEAGPVPVDCGSPLGGYSLPGDDGDNNGFDDPGSRCEGFPHRPVAPNLTEAAGFALDLAALPDIYADPQTGARYLYVEVQALSGASENDFQIWAGPPEAEAPANMNLRNVWLLDGGELDPAGVQIENINVLNVNAQYSGPTSLPLLALGPDDAGTTIGVSLFDPDAGTVPPITFYFNTIPTTTFAVSYDSRGCWGTTGCNNLWVGPPGDPSSEFLIDIPADFISGTLMVDYQQGKMDTYSLVVTLPERPVSPTQLSLTALGPTATLVFAGEQISLVAEVRNDGTAWGQGLVLTQTLPAGVSLEAITATGLILHESGLDENVWLLDDLAPGSSGQLTVTLRLPANLGSAALAYLLQLSGANDDSAGDDQIVTLLQPAQRFYLPLIRQPAMAKPD